MSIQELILKCNIPLKHGVFGPGITLINYAVTCWGNSFLQVILHSKEFIKIINNINKKFIPNETLKQIFDLINIFHLKIFNSHQVTEEEIKSFLTKVSNILGDICVIGRFHDSDEILILLIDKFLNLEDFTSKSEVVNFYIPSNFSQDEIDNKIKNIISGFKISSFGNTFRIEHRAYDNDCTPYGKSEKIKGSIQITSDTKSLLVLTCYNYIPGDQNTHSIEEMVRIEEEKIEDQQDYSLNCGGIENLSKIKIKFSDGSVELIPIKGDPINDTSGNFTNDTSGNIKVKLQNKILYYTRNIAKELNLGQLPNRDDSSKNPLDGWVISKKFEELKEEIPTLIKLCNGIKLTDEFELEKGTPNMNTKLYNQSVISDNSNILMFKLARPNDPIDYSYSKKINVNEEINLKNGKKYILIGGTINVRLAGNHYTSFVRRNDLYWLQDDSKLPQKISLNDASISKETTFLLYEVAS